MAKLYILSGYPFAGKSTVARALVDRFGLVRVALDEDVTEDQHVRYDNYRDRVAGNLAKGKSVITDTVGHKRHGRDDLRKLAEENNAEAIVLYVATPVEVAKERWQKNRHTHGRHDVDDDTFYDIVKEFEVPGADENVITITPEMTTEEICSLIG